MKKLNYLILILLIGTMFSCTSGKKSLKHGNYYQSVIQSVERLRKSPNNKNAIETLSSAYPMAESYYKSNIERMKGSQDRFKNGKIVESYRILNNMHDQIQRCPGALNVIPYPTDYYNQLKLYTTQAAEERYQAGVEALGMGSRNYALEAYDHFMRANDFSPGYKDVADKIEEARYFATLKILVDQVPVPTVQYQLSVQFFQDQVEQFLFNYHENEFVRFYSIQDSSLQNPDQILIVQFEEFVVGQTNNFKNTTEHVRDSVVVGQVTLENGDKADVFGTVKAKLTENKRQVISKGLVSMRIIDAASNTVVLHDKFPGEFVWTNVWGSFNGDERALTREQIDITKHQPMDPPPPQDLFIEFCRPIYGQITSRVSNYYRNL